MIDQILKEFDEKFTQLCYDSKDANVEFIGFKGNCEKARTWLKEKLTSFEIEILENYSRWLEKHSYIDSDWWSEGNTVN